MNPATLPESMMEAWTQRVRWRNEPLCSMCLGHLGVSKDGNVFCKSCGCVMWTAEDISFLKAAKQKGFKA